MIVFTIQFHLVARPSTLHSLLTYNLHKALQGQVLEKSLGLPGDSLLVGGGGIECRVI